MTIKRNSAKCAHCGIELESTYRWDFKSHTCTEAGKISKSYDHDKKEYVPDYPFFAVDGGKDYLRRLGHREDWVDTSEEWEEVIEE